MPRQRDPKRAEAFEIWKQQNGNITNREISRRLEVPEKTISAWKFRDKWNEVLQNSDRSTTKAKVSKGSKGKKSKKNKNASGNPNPKNQFTERNQAARKHGLFSRYIPAETLEIMGMLNKNDPADLIWDQIMIQYAAIIRAQQIMFVHDKDDITKVQSQVGFGENRADRYEFQFAWEKHAAFLNAQSKAIGELRSSIKQFVEMAHDDDERRLKLKQMQLNIEKTNAEIAKLNRAQGDSDQEKDVAAALRGLVDAINSETD